MRLFSSIKSVDLIRSNLQGIPNAVRSAPPRRPRFHGEVSAVSGGEGVSLELGSPDAGREARVDVRRSSALFTELDAAFHHQGFEALAWYHPFHLSAAEWGIYIPLTSVHYGANRWFSPRLEVSKRISLAFQALFHHEIIHFGCEYSIAQFELLLRACCWFPAHERVTAAGLEWFNDEEALANANSLRELRKFAPKINYKLFENALQQCPVGYKNYADALDDVDFDEHAMEVLRHNVGVPAVDLETGFLNPAFNMLSLFLDDDEARGLCPIYFIQDDTNLDIPPLFPKQVTSIAEIIESKKFQKMLVKLDPRRQSDWHQMKGRLSKEVPRYPAFKMLKGKMQGLWGLYLSDGFRAHLRPLANGAWEAVEIGTHSAMGHG